MMSWGQSSEQPSPALNSLQIRLKFYPRSFFLSFAVPCFPQARKRGFLCFPQQFSCAVLCFLKATPLETSPPFLTIFPSQKQTRKGTGNKKTGVVKCSTSETAALRNQRELQQFLPAGVSVLLRWEDDGSIRIFNHPMLQN